MPQKLKIAIVHDWMVNRGGAERVVLDMHEIWPNAVIFTAAYDPLKFPEFGGIEIHTTWLNRIKLAKTKHQLFSLPRAWAFRSLDLSDFDIVISSSSAESKYIKTGSNTLHICYCYTPIRYYWSDYEWYRQHPPFGVLNPVAQILLPVMIGYLRSMDYKMAQKVDKYLTQSKYIQEKIQKYYHRDSEVIHPGTKTDEFTHIIKEPGEYYLIVGRQVAYKRLDLAVSAFNELGFPLKIAGVGEEIGVQQKIAKSNIEFLGFVSEDELPKLYANAKAVLYPQEEDYGLVPVEAQAAGTPVIAFGKGGASETVIDGKTGVLFWTQTEKALIDAVKKFETMKFEPEILRKHAKTFDSENFKRELRNFVEKSYESFLSSSKS